MAMLRSVEVTCPVSPDVLGRLYRADDASAADMLHGLPESQRADLAFFCYGRTHLRTLAMTVAATCDAVRLEQRAGILGHALATQCRQPRADARSKVSLAGTRH